MTKQIAKLRHPKHNIVMKMKTGAASFALVLLLLANAAVSVARADEHLTVDQTALPILFNNNENSFDFSGSSDVSQIGPSVSSLSLSPSPVPEPSAIGLTVTGIMALVAFGASKRRSSQRR